MSTGLQFDDEMARRIEAIYVSGDAFRRRRAVLDVLELKSDEQILDIGTGPGFLAHEMADAVGQRGAVLAVDFSDSMLGLARTRCLDRQSVRFQKAEATQLPVPDGSFDVAVSVQVYEYVAEVEKALAEMFRVLRPGGRAAVVCTDWDSIVWQATSRERMQKVLSAYAEHCVHSNLPRTLVPKLRQAGFKIQSQRVIPQFNLSLEPNTFSYGLVNIIRSFVPGRQGVTKEEADQWSDDLRQLAEQEEYFFCLNQFLYLVTKPQR
jgi:arsenite methyltransferase